MSCDKIKIYKRKTGYRKPGNLMIKEILKKWNVDIKKSLIHENIYVYYFIIIFIIFNILHELLKFERYLKN